jgi:hypothetical protein
VDGAGAAFAISGFTGKEQRAGDRLREPPRRLGSSDASIAVGAARERIVFPIVQPRAYNAIRRSPVRERDKPSTTPKILVGCVQKAQGIERAGNRSCGEPA